MGQATPSAVHVGRFTKLLAAVALLLAAGAGLTLTWRSLQDRRLLHTGNARWIWFTREIQQPELLRFRAWKDFRIDGAPPPTAPARLFGDRGWSLEVNGEPIATGTQAPGDALRVLDLAKRLRQGPNRVSIEAGSSNGVGGILFWLDLGGGRALVSDGTWRVQKIPAGLEGERAAAVWGRPPIYPWRYPPLPDR